MKKQHILIGFLIFAALLCVNTAVWAGEASFFDDAEKILIRAFTTIGSSSTCGTSGTDQCYSAYLEVRDSDGVKISAGQLVVEKLENGNPPVTVTAEPDNTYLVHNNNLTSPDISMSFDTVNGITYIFCTDTGLHVMKYRISTLYPVDGACGSANGGAFYTAPATNLCSAGTATAVSGTGPWTWDCAGLNGGLTANCSANKKVDGACGSANGGTFTSLTSIDPNLCSAGTPTSFSGSGPWTWTCSGSNGGTNASCSANIQSSGSVNLYINQWGVSSTNCHITFTVNSVQVINSGTAAAGPFKVKLYVTTGDTIAGATLMATKDVSGLGAGQSETLNFGTISCGGLPLHLWYHLLIVADADNQVIETNEGDNMVTRDMWAE